MRKNKTFCFIACLLICLAIVFPFVLTILQAEHHCEGAHCHICMDIRACKLVFGAVLLTFPGLTAFFLPGKIRERGGDWELINMRKTPVSLGVKLKN